jgi:short subunit dehydrogenase-like uncharacterized protein
MAALAPIPGRLRLSLSMRVAGIQAAKKGVKIVPMCGYESIPSDLGTLMVVDYMRDKLDR